LSSQANRTDNEEESLNTLFVRTILLSMAVLVSIRAGVMLLAPESPMDESALQAAVLDARAATDVPLDFTGESAVAPAPRFSLMPATERVDFAAPPKLVDFRSAVYDARSAGGFLNVSESTVLPLDTGPLDDTQWSDTPDAVPETGVAMAGWFAAFALLVLAGVSAWRARRPLLDMTQAARESACGRSLVTTVREEGPSELRRVVRSFNDMLRRRNEALEEQGVALAGLARHMEYQAARLRDRALEVNEWHQRVAFVEDIDAFTDIAQQLLDVVHQRGNDGQDEQIVSVDGFLRDRYSMIGALDEKLFTCDLKAGPQFAMSRPLLERLMTNLVDNALEHGAPPIEIRTARTQDGWLLSVRDHGTGIEEHALSSATQPFVRLKHTPRGDPLNQHWGLGLAVVARLARRCGASLELGNHAEGGLCVRLTLPVAAAAR
jgi:two-component system, OmpR family, osmolarity sensor histidine kinase EnvZ